MHGSKGNTIEAHEALNRMGADVMRWMYCAQTPTQGVKFGYAPAAEIKRRLLTLWNSVRFFVDYANIASFRPEWGKLPARDALRPLDRWLIDRTHEFVETATRDGYERFLTVNVIRAFDAYVDDVSNWYIRRSRRRFWDGDHVALNVLWLSLVQSLRVVAPMLPFLSDYLWQRLVADVDPQAPRSIHLAGWPEPPPADAALLEEVREVRRIVELARQARSAAGLKLRQPLRRLVVDGAPRAQTHADEIADELRVKEVEFAPIDAAEVRVKPNLPVLGPKLGKELGPVRQALSAGDWEQLPGGGVRVNGHELAPDEVLVERTARPGWALAEEDGVTVAVSTELDDELLLEGRVLDLIHLVNTKRKDAGLELTDRIRLTLPAADADLLAHEQRIKDEVLAVEIRTDGVAEPEIAKV
jgi:isoleucyl-tRNA synthetase